MKLFDLVKILFSYQQEYSKVKKYDKAKNRFMINRFMAINYPIQAQLLNLKNIPGEYVVDSWYLVTKKYTKIPYWMYTKVNLNREKNNKIEFIPNDETIKFYINKLKIDRKDFETYLKFNKRELYEELKWLEDQMSVNKNLCKN